MFYKTGVDVTKDKEMWQFLHDHFTYSTLNSWNGLYSVANKVKIYSLGLEGDCWTALKFLEEEEYATVNQMIEDWEYDHKGYKVGFNGRSSGYLVLYNERDMKNVLDDYVTEFDDYGSFKEAVKAEGERVLDWHGNLVAMTKLVRDFDKLCDDIRDYVNDLSKMSFSGEAMNSAVSDFNCCYSKDLSLLGLKPLEVKDGKVDVSGISVLKSLTDAFADLLSRTDKSGCRVERSEDGRLMWLKED